MIKIPLTIILFWIATTYALSQTIHHIDVLINQPPCILGLTDDVALVYPNPVSKYLIIESEFESCEIYDAVGRKYELKYDRNEKKLDVSPLKEGIYFLQLTDSNGSSVVKLKIEKQ